MGETNQRTIFLLAEDDETRVPLVRNLRRYGYCVITAPDEKDTLQRVGGGRVAVDLIWSISSASRWTT